MKKISAGHYQKQAHPRQVHDGWAGFSAPNYNIYPSQTPVVSTASTQHHANNDLIQTFATFQYQKPFPPHLRIKKSKKAAADKTMYQPFIRKGIENGHQVPPPPEIPIQYSHRSARGARRPQRQRSNPDDANRSNGGIASSKSPLPHEPAKPTPKPQFAMEVNDFPSLGNQTPQPAISPGQSITGTGEPEISLKPLANLLKLSESPKKKAPGSLPKKSPKSTPAPKKEDLKPTPQDAPLPSTTAKSAWPNTGKTLAEVFKTQPVTTIPIEKPNIQTSATPQKPASIASDKDASGGAKPAQRASQNPAKKTHQSRQKAAAAPQPKRQVQQESAKESPKQADETIENTDEEPGWVTVEVKKKVRDNKSETSDTDDTHRTQKRGNGAPRREDGDRRRERRYTGDRAPRAERDGNRGGRRDRRDRDRNNNQANEDAEKTIVHPPTPPPANTLELFPNLVESPPHIPAIASPVPIQGRWADIASK